MPSLVARLFPFSLASVAASDEDAARSIRVAEIERLLAEIVASHPQPDAVDRQAREYGDCMPRPHDHAASCLPAQTA